MLPGPITDLGFYLPDSLLLTNLWKMPTWGLKLYLSEILAQFTELKIILAHHPHPKYDDFNNQYY